MKYAITKIRIDEFDFSGLAAVRFYWEISIYEDIRELKLSNISEPLGSYVILTYYVTTNPMHCI